MRQLEQIVDRTQGLRNCLTELWLAQNAPKAGNIPVQAMLERTALEVAHLKHRRQLNKKLLRAQQSKAFFVEDLARGQQRKGDAQQGNQQVQRALFLHRCGRLSACSNAASWPHSMRDWSQAC